MQYFSYYETAKKSQLWSQGTFDQFEHSNLN